MRKWVFLAALVAALAVPAFALAKPPVPTVICGYDCGGGPGSSGCWQSTWWSDRGFEYFAYTHHVVVVSYCKSNGIITSLSIDQHYCNVSGFVSCSPGAAYVTSGGPGATAATIVAYANVQPTPGRLMGWSITDTIDGTIQPG